LWVVDSFTGEERRVGPVVVPAVRPAVSPDGKMVAFADGRSGDVYLAAFDDPFARGGR
jgi:Tol biopolymer transport system component